ncbi:hypothetical protein J7I98_08310 [Streptomyces sp. ISL-98]|uniref:hypothetical protein n=1 Tax=Streptomyces sp. ISL-98 TaxID=2819192 RepID=UPI001BEB355B|nr:hypothetical protein [Streptomyces sp. ISL-98]MBT2505902.1 hypothetical protein [Streptomyces sp. ISL-98]
MKRTSSTWADLTMLTSVIRDATAQYIATLLFAITMIVGSVLRAQWRRKLRKQTSAAGRPRMTDAPSGPGVCQSGRRTRRQHLLKMSSDRRRKESS